MRIPPANGVCVEFGMFNMDARAPLRSTFNPRPSTFNLQHSIIAFSLIASFIALSGCTTTRLESDRRDPNFSGPAFQRILVVGVAREAAARRRFEDQLVADLRAQGVHAIPSYSIIPEDGPVPRERLEQAVDQTGAQAVLLTRLVGVDTRTATQVDQTPYNGGFYGYYGGPAWYGPVYGSSTAYQYQIYTLETRLFDVPRDRIVWTGTTTTEDPISRKKEVEKFSRLITTELAKERLI